MSIISRMIIENPGIHNPLGLVVALPGRGISLNEMYRFMLYTGLNKSIIAVIEPRNLQWYRSPNGVNDQQHSLHDCDKAIKPLKRTIGNLCRNYKIPYKKVAVVGYSAGGVMALSIAQQSKKELGIFISIAGTILDSKNIPSAKNNTPILMKNCQDDEVFQWQERHEPARNGLLEKGYNLILEEKSFGGHALCAEDADLVSRFISEKFGY